MKKTIICFFFLLASANFSLYSSGIITNKDNVLTATFKEVTDNDEFSFEDDKKVVHVFYDMNEEIEIDLYDEDWVGKKFTITWIEKTIDVFDDEDEPTGKKIKVKSIIALKEVKQ